MLMLNTPMVDYITLTTFDANLYGYWAILLGVRYSDKLSMPRPTRWENYHGIKRTLGGGSKGGGGTYFLGQGEQANKVHYCVWVSSALAHYYYTKLHAMEFGEVVVQAKCTRLDPQMTVPCPKWWKQVDLLVHCLDAGMPADILTSPDDGLQSVYIGSKKSDFYIVVYEKKNEDGDKFLRLECRLSNVRKPGRADFAAMAAVRAQTLTDNDYLKAYIAKALDRIKYDGLDGLFAAVLNGGLPAVSVPYEKSNKTREWLMGTVATSLDRYLRENDGDLEVAGMFDRITSQFLPKGEC